MIIGGERKTIVVDGEPKYSVLYEITSPDVLTSEAWAKAVDSGLADAGAAVHAQPPAHFAQDHGLSVPPDCAACASRNVAVAIAAAFRHARRIE